MEIVTCEKPTEVVGMLFQIYGADSTPELWHQCKQAAIDDKKKQPPKDSYIYTPNEFYGFMMPCSSYMSFPSPKSIMDLPIEDIPCGCGDKTHWYIRFSAMK